MNNLIVTIFGGLLIIAGFYAMSFGFAIPPNFVFFFLGLCAAVLGLFLVVLFSSGIDMSQIRSSPSSSKTAPSPAQPAVKSRPKPVKVEKKVSKEDKRKETLENIEKTIKPQPRIKKPKKADRPDMVTPSSIGEAKTDKLPSKTKDTQIGMTEIKPQKKTDIGESPTLPPELTSKKSPRIKKPVEATESKGEIEPVKEAGTGKEPKIIKPVKTAEPSVQEKPPVPRRPDMDKLRAMQPKKEDEFVKKRLDKLKENYIQNAKDIESIIDERLDSFKGTLGKLKSESQEPGIIWSFDAGDVQEAMMDTISKANQRILMMYPWIRNIDVSILKKFMETESCMIIQEASLDDDASVELLKLLIDKDVKIRTMPHVHTIAVVSDESNGLIISTDPIYESYEVGVVYKDQKSIEEIERMFKDAWSISQDIDLEIKS
jgi:hypothetical protein